MDIIKINMFAHVITLSFVVLAGLYVMMSSHLTVGWKVYAVFVMVSAVVLLVQRETYLPFLGRAAFPSGAIKSELHPEGANVSHELSFDAKDEGKRVVYWGAKPSNQIASNPWDAYGEFDNAGVAIIRNGKATIKFFCPSKYQIPWGKTLDRHIHYRVCCDQGLMGHVKTAYIHC